MIYITKILTIFIILISLISCSKDDEHKEKVIVVHGKEINCEKNTPLNRMRKAYCMRNKDISKKQSQNKLITSKD